ncbi:condensin complex subunit 3-like [Dendronephthya gigantea]|uniref:condensin complex subunit 3-like n=1 Tax=Dendronephthya gigantea TaxID=151771 RepID=UPI0010691F90|nr:condensin complex subunit 3-like [Dendronephthya gigantea]XP_028390823.1 condensin complex subunit 3-like [Dendronephthya gigantea]
MSLDSKNNKKNSFSNVKEVFNVAQKGSQHEESLFRALDSLAQSDKDEEEFLEEFIHCMKYCMIVFQKEPAVERMMDFIAMYTTRITKDQSDQVNASYAECDDESDDIIKNMFLSNILNFLLDVHDAQDKAVRYRTCQLISKIFQNLEEETTINEQLADKILTAMMTRLCDKIPIVRSQAICALSRLQDPMDPKCPVVEVYLYMMRSDNSADVRKMTLQNIAITQHTLPYIVERTRDIKDAVRKYAFFVLGTKVSIRALTIAQRVQLLHDGLNDRVQSVKQSCYSKLLLSWVKSCDENIIKLLELLDIENSVKTAETVVKELLKGTANDALLFHVKLLKEFMGASQTISLEELNSERVLFWQCLVEHCVSLGPKAQDILDSILPEISGFCEYIQSFMEKFFSNCDKECELHEVFIMQQLLTIAAYMDLADEVGRKRLTKLVQEMMVNPNIPTFLMPILHERYTNLEPDEETRINQIAEVIADIKEPITVVETPQINQENRARELKLAGIRVKINQVRDELESFVSAQEFDKAAEAKNKLSELDQEKSDLESEANSVNNFQTRIEKNDPETLVKCLSIASGLLQNITQSNLNNPTLSTLVETLILPGVQSEEPMLRQVAVECLGLCSLLSKDFARRHLVLFLQIVLLDAEEVQIAALKSIFDLLHVYGLETFKVTPAEQAILEAEESLLEPEDDLSDDDSSDDDNNDVSIVDKAGVDEKENDENEKILDEAQKSVSSVFSTLIHLLDRENTAIRNVAAEGFAKLLLSGRVHSPKLFSRLLLLWYNPMTEDDIYLRDCIGVFLTAFANECRAFEEQIEEAFMPTLRTLFIAPTSSPLAQVDVSNVAELLVHLTSDKNLVNQTQATTQNSNETATRNEDNTEDVRPDTIHGSLALKIANEIISEPFSPGVRVLCKTLTQLQLMNAKKSVLKDLSVLHEAMIKELEDNNSIKYLEKFHQSLVVLLRGDTEECEESERTINASSIKDSSVENTT